MQDLKDRRPGTAKVQVENLKNCLEPKFPKVFLKETKTAFVLAGSHREVHTPRQKSLNELVFSHGFLRTSPKDIYIYASPPLQGLPFKIKIAFRGKFA